MTPRYLGSVPHPAIGVRMPDIFLNGILSGCTSRRTAGGLMLSCTREAAPQDVIDAQPGEYPITLGHTGVSIKEYILKSAEAARKYGATVEIEADHLIVSPSVQAVQRILGGSKRVELTDEEISNSIALVKRAIDEAASTSLANAFTVDTTSLIDLDVERAPIEEVVDRFSNEIPDGRDLIDEYSRESTYSSIDGNLWKIKFDEHEVMRMALEFKKSLEVCYDIYLHVKEKMTGKPFGFELTLDELPKPTGKEIAFYLREWKKMGPHVDFVAPNIGFRKRADFDGDFGALRQRLSFLAAIASGHGALLSIHSGSGQSPHSGKGRGVYEAIIQSTAGRVKYKISGVYFELLMDLLADSKNQRHRQLFNRIFDDVIAYLQGQVDADSPLVDSTLREMFSKYKENARMNPTKMRESRSELFRFYSFISLNLRESEGRRYLKDELVRLYEDDEQFRQILDQEVKSLTLRLTDGLRFSNNIAIAQA